jgi:uncharacterized membrane protein
MSCEARYDVGLFSWDVHILGYDCTADWVFPVVLVCTFLLKLIQNRIWAWTGQAQRVALQHDQRERGPYVWSLVYLEAMSTALGIVSIVLILGTNVWVLLVILLGNMVGVYQTYSNMKKDAHSTAHDLVDMLEAAPNKQKNKFLVLLKQALNEPADFKPKSLPELQSTWYF